MTHSTWQHPFNGKLALGLAIGIVGLSMYGTTIAGSREPAVPLSLSRIQGLSSSQISSLQHAGIQSLASLASSNPEQLANTLNINTKQAVTLIERAKQERSLLNQTLVNQRNRFKLPKIVIPGSYASLITPTNECTILVRKVCGQENQCSTSPGCEVSMTLLQRFNATTTDNDRIGLAESCLMALQDQTLFPECTP